MNEPALEPWETRLRVAAGAFPYPPTPDLAGAVERRLPGAARPAVGRRWAWAVAVALFLLGGLLAVPQVRAAVLEFLQIGAVRIFLVEPTPTATPPVTPLPAATPPVTPAAAPSPTATPRPTPTPLVSVLDLAGETTLAEAETRAGFPIRLPAQPPDLGPPDRVFLQDLGGPVVVLVWLEPGRPEAVRLSLHMLGPGTAGQKFEPPVVQETTVNGRPAVWTEGPYLLQFQRGRRVDFDTRRLVEGHVLLWVEGEITYRLETDLPLAAAVRIAESLR